MKNVLLILNFLYIIQGVLSNNIYCSGHDACKNNVWNGEYNIYCGGTNSERTCKSTTLNCGKDKDCYIETRGSGHDAYQYSTVNAKESNSFKLKCSASGHRDCKTITVFCPQKSSSSCECISCPSTVTFKCVKDISCSSVSNAKIEYISPDKYTIPDSIWLKDTEHTGKRPDCPFSSATSNQNYLWGTLNNCKQKCIEETTGKCNIVNRYGDSIKRHDELYHCRFYECPDPYNLTWITQEQWGNYASDSNSYILPIRHYTLNSRYINITKYINVTNYNNITREIFNYINTSNYYYDEEVIKNVCIEGQYKYYSGNSNEAWTRKSWLLGCEQFSLGYKTLSQCKSRCNCNNSPSKYSSHPKFKQCNKISASSNYLPCRQNACSGGNCCSRSSTICKTGCKIYHSIKSDGKIITHSDIERIVNKYFYTNLTRFINLTRYINITKEVVNIVEKYRYINKTNIKNITNFITKTIWHNLYNITYIDRNKTSWNNKTRWSNRTRWQNRTRWIDKINWITKTRWKNKTRWIDKINWKNKTRWNNMTRWNNRTLWIDKIRWKNKTRWINNISVITEFQTVKDNYSYNNGYSDSSYDFSQSKSCNCSNLSQNSDEIPGLLQIFTYVSFIIAGIAIILAFLYIIKKLCNWCIEDHITEYIDETFCCGYLETIKNIKDIICCCIECNDSLREEETDEHTSNNKNSLEMVPPIVTASPLEDSFSEGKIPQYLEMGANITDETVTTPGGTRIRRRRVEI